MAYSMLGAAATLSPEAATAALAAGLRALPPCYDGELEACIQRQPSRVPGCAAINAAYDSSKANFDKMESAVDAMTFCPPGTPRDRVWIIGGACVLLGAVLGVVIAKR